MATAAPLASVLTPTKSPTARLERAIGRPRLIVLTVAPIENDCDVPFLSVIVRLVVVILAMLPTIGLFFGLVEEPVAEEPPVLDFVPAGTAPLPVRQVPAQRRYSLGFGRHWLDCRPARYWVHPDSVHSDPAHPDLVRLEFGHRDRQDQDRVPRRVRGHRRARVRPPPEHPMQTAQAPNKLSRATHFDKP